MKNCKNIILSKLEGQIVAPSGKAQGNYLTKLYRIENKENKNAEK
ncbi:MAG: hypothetical protein RO257_04995 [Candidatus Kapabacteria bacterium]|jgi:hypothetical protein|nr:hypothetical protein [Candidatus Kapabacteria bacterium]